MRRNYSKLDNVLLLSNLTSRFATFEGSPKVGRP